MQEMSLLTMTTVGRGHVIFTSRNRQLDRLGHLMEIPAMSGSEGVNLLLRRSNAVDIQQYFPIASNIVKRLGGLPLAIDQAAAYIQYQHLPLDHLGEFLTSYETKSQTILSHIPANSWEYRLTHGHGKEEQNRALSAFTTWEMSLEQLSTQNSFCFDDMTHFLSLSAYFNPSKIEEFLFRNYWNMHSYTAGWLCFTSTDEKKPKSSAMKRPVLRVCPPRRKVSRKPWSSENFWDVLSKFHESSLLQSLERAGEDAVFSLHPLIRDWLQLRAEKKKRQAYIEESIEVVAASVRFGHNKVMSFEHNSALLAHIDACLANEERFSKKQHQLGNRIENCDTAGWLADFYHKQGRYKVAEKLFREIVATEQNVLGLEHENTMRDMDSLANVFCEQGNFDEAETLFLQTLEFRQKLFGEKNANTMQSLDNVASISYKKGKYDDADMRFRQVLQWRITELGQEHPNTLSTMGRLGWVVQAQGKYEEAEKMQRQILDLTEQTRGSEHSECVISMSSLASTLYVQHKFEEAEQLQRQVLYLHEKWWGKRHPDTLTSMNDLALTLQELGKLEEAEQIHREELRLSQEVLGNKHPETLASMSNLAEVLRSQGSVEAEKLHRETLELKKQALGMEHPGTLHSMNNLASTLPDHEAESLYRETLRLRQKVLGERHPDLLGTMHNLAYTLPDDEAEPLFRETLRLEREVLGMKHSDTLITMHNFASILPNHEAEPLFREALRLRVEVLGKKHSDTLITMEWLAWVLRKQGKNDEAEGIMKDLALLLREQGKNDKVIEMEQQHRQFQQLNDGHSDCLNGAGESSR